MKAVLHHTYKLFTPEEAERTAKMMNENETDGWTYIVNHDPTGCGFSYISIYDENGEFVEKL